jgi:N-acylneuraminate cytidylyltransferase
MDTDAGGSVLVVMPARGGSKGLPGKNLREVGGISLTGRAVRVGLAFLRERALSGTVFVDTDAPDIAAEGVRHGAEAPFLRPPELAGDATPMIDNVLHAVDRFAAMGREHGVVVLLQPTSPLRETEDVLACWDAFRPPDVDSVVAVTPPDHPPEHTLRMGPDGVLTWAWPELALATRRQDLPRSLRPTGSVYVSTVDSLRRHRTFLVAGRTRGVEVPRERSVDVDTAADLALAEHLLR